MGFRIPFVPLAFVPFEHLNDFVNSLSYLYLIIYCPIKLLKNILAKQINWNSRRFRDIIGLVQRPLLSVEM